MTERQMAWLILLCGAGLGVLGDQLLDGSGPGLNITLLLTALAGVGLFLGRHTQQVASLRLGAALLVVMAAGFSWRSDEMLLSVDGLGLLVVLSVLTTEPFRWNARLVGIDAADLTARGIKTGLKLAAGPLSLTAPLRSPEPEPAVNQTASQLGAVLRGAALALPALGIFGALLASADQRFDALLSRVFHFNLETLAGHIFRSGLIAWPVVGVLTTVLIPEAKPSANSGGGRFAIGLVESTVVLASLDLLFLVFVVVQGSYLFGGDRLVQTTSDLSYAEYARRGFFQLVAVAALSIPVLLLAARRRDSETTPRYRWFRPLAVLQVALLFLILASATHRLMLYVSRFGLTLDRLDALAVLGWVAVTLLWLSVTVLRDRPERFVAGSLVAAGLILAGLFAVNPSATVVRINMGRAAAGVPPDIRYLASLGADGLPALIDAVPAMDAGQRAVAGDVLCQIRPDRYESRTWNWSRSRANNALRDFRRSQCASAAG